MNSKKYSKSTHRIVALSFVPNPNKKPCIDHIDNNRVNNRLDNLRWCTHQENMLNRSLFKTNTSGFKGVYFIKTSNKWCARISIDGIRINLGTFKNIEDAVQARVTRANQAFGVFTNACEKIN